MRRRGGFSEKAGLWVLGRALIFKKEPSGVLEIDLNASEGHS